MAVPLDPPPVLAVTRTFKPYYSPYELAHLSHLQAASRSHPDNVHLAQHRLHHLRQLACGYIERVAQRIGFPRRTIATAQTLYLRFHLHFPLRDFNYQDVSLSALLVASKLEDTLKKLRDIQIAGWQIANVMDGGPGLGEGDQAAQEAHRPNLVGIERLILQTICFSFNLLRSAPSTSTSAATSPPSRQHARDPDALSTSELVMLATTTSSPLSKDLFTHLVRLSALLPLPELASSLSHPSSTTSVPTSTTASTTTTTTNLAKSFTYLAFLLATDLHRTLAPLSYPPHTCAAACLRLAAFLFPPLPRLGLGLDDDDDDVDVDEGHEARESLPDLVGRRWAEQCRSNDEDLDDIAQTLLDLLIDLCPPPPSTSTSTLAASGSTRFALSSSSSTTVASPSTSTTHHASPPSEFLPPPPVPSSSSSSLVSSNATHPRQTERDRHLAQSGIPNAFSHPAFAWTYGTGRSLAFATTDGSTTAARGVVWTVDKLREVKIRVRASGESRRSEHRDDADATTLNRNRLGSDSTSTSSRIRPGEAGEGDLGPSKRWRSITREQGLNELDRLRSEADDRDRVKLEERDERERDRERGGGTEEERERERQERRDRRERAKPASVRYLF
ncbi:hypothetical protein JCM10212_006554 [Sporobolomyces blumeae]